MNVETVKIDTIKPYWRNPRNNNAAVDAVKESIEKYGYNVPIIIDSGGVIITGHTRYKALVKLGYDDVQVIRTDMTPEKAKEYRIADNRTSELSTWNYDNLIPELREIEGIEDFIGTFYPDGDLDKWMDDINPGMMDPIQNDAPEPVTYGNSSSDDYTPPISNGYQSVTQADIDKAEARMHNSFNNAVDDYFDDLIELTCPDCGQTFFIKGSEVATRVRLKQEFKKMAQ